MLHCSMKYSILFSFMFALEMFEESSLLFDLAEEGVFFIYKRMVSSFKVRHRDCSLEIKLHIHYHYNSVSSSPSTTAVSTSRLRLAIALTPDS